MTPSPLTALTQERNRQKLSLRELAHFVGCAHTTLARIEGGAIDPAPSLKAAIARALRVPVQDIWPAQVLADRLGSPIWWAAADPDYPIDRLGINGETEIDGVPVKLIRKFFAGPRPMSAWSSTQTR